MPTQVVSTGSLKKSDDDEESEHSLFLFGQ